MKKIILGISGSIAAYKSAILTRLLVKKGIDVRVMMTPSATSFISPLTLSTLSKHPVLTEINSEEAWNNHVELGLWADALVIAPATANTLAKLANGICDNLLTAVYLSARCPVFVAPAMDLDMWTHPATRSNLERLQAHGVQLIPVGFGELASGLVGDGRMAEPEDILAYLERFSQRTQRLNGKKALITAGPTFEPLDPVRYIGNHSTGKMGIALAESLAREGAEVRLVLGPTNLKPENPAIHVIRTTTAQEMYEACAPLFPDSDITILAAAVADYRPANYSGTKIKKKDSPLAIELAETIDIAATLGKQKRSGQLLVGFALETNDEEANALVKLKKKNLDFIVLNSLRDSGAGFGHDTNKVAILHNTGQKTTFKLKAKTAVADDIVAEIIRLANPKAKTSVRKKATR
ncbi:MAG: bifunctional phosphopantothenoylcysteine decarboxylase/phosphopantothenate--cysteine ligase CoaBC [Lewinellaceae bacterium]|nr:bifunctional phosphopantothenoylcysteine decarboxylase/phosphopantothenate--cysteine ligase CoaBC [Saprospiraceae bacterium]MCB9333951.1 bifunctional phosphopantothenoylcysteine decarboxylase/phosphopantothenate--cysteine ligase CoaBC [Lewinellaceae bacterium]